MQGHRPALFNQDGLINLRKEKGVDTLLPGITDWAQVNSRDELLITDKLVLDVEYLNRQSFWFDGIFDGCKTPYTYLDQ